MWEENVSGGHVLDFYFELSSCDAPSYPFLQTISYIMMEIRYVSKKERFYHLVYNCKFAYVLKHANIFLILEVSQTLLKWFCTWS